MKYPLQACGFVSFTFRVSIGHCLHLLYEYSCWLVTPVISFTMHFQCWLDWLNLNILLHNVTSINYRQIFCSYRGLSHEYSKNRKYNHLYLHLYFQAFGWCPQATVSMCSTGIRIHIFVISWHLHIKGLNLHLPNNTYKKYWKTLWAIIFTYN